MPVDSTLLASVLTTGGVGIAIAFILILLGVMVPGYAYRRALEEIDKRDSVIERLRETLESERHQSNEVVRAASVTNQFFEALVGLARTSQIQAPDPGPGDAPPRQPRTRRRQP